MLEAGLRRLALYDSLPAVKLVEIIGSKGSYSMNRFLTVPLSKGIIVDGAVELFFPGKRSLRLKLAMD